jgi:hypothetical protein
LDALATGKIFESPYRDQTLAVQQRNASTVSEYLTDQAISSAYSNKTKMLQCPKTDSKVQQHIKVTAFHILSIPVPNELHGADSSRLGQWYSTFVFAYPQM